MVSVLRGSGHEVLMLPDGDMIRSTIICRMKYAALSAVLAILVLLTATPSLAETFVEVFGKLSNHTWIYPESAAHPGQRSHTSGLAGETTIYVEDDEGRSFTLTPFYRVDAADAERTHADLRDAYLLVYGDVGDSEWEFRLGFDRVFWGVTESRSLVDIVNQISPANTPGDETKLGQPMAHITLSGDFGVLEAFAMTWHRPLALPGRKGRLRGPEIVGNDRVTYESASEEWHVDLAGRYANSFGPFDIGLSVFDGTSREPTFLLTRAGLVPHYEQIRQFGLDAQYTSGPWLLKLEAIHRTGARNRRFDGASLRFEEENYAAFVTGAEYTIWSLWDTDADLSLIAEWNRDDRGRWATNAFENDLLLATRIGLNDEMSTEFFISVFNSLENDSKVISGEFKRRLDDNWFMSIQGTAYANIAASDILYNVRRDSFIGLNLDYSF